MTKGGVRMTIAISIKNGVVLATDSASTLMSVQENTSNILNVYNNATKVFNLRKTFPIGVITWGLGNIGSASISTLMKDLRKRFTANTDETYANWVLDTSHYTVEEVAQHVRQFFYEENYLPIYREIIEKDPTKTPPLGFIVAGYSGHSDYAEEYLISIQNGLCEAPRLLRTEKEAGLFVDGQPEAIYRLVFGTSSLLPQVLIENLGVLPEQIPQIMSVFIQTLQAPLVIDSMPLQDAIELAIFLAETTIQFIRFMPGAQIVGGQIEVAAISKHEGFKWIQRKHYFSQQLNPKE